MMPAHKIFSRLTFVAALLLLIVGRYTGDEMRSVVGAMGTLIMFCVIYGEKE